MLIDQFGRNHNYLRISLTDKCNLRCKYCMPSEKMNFMPERQLMTPDEVIGIASEFVKHGVTKIRLTGGEPLVYRGFDDVFERLSSLGVSMHLTTNGVFLHNHLQKMIAHGLKDVNISLDTLKSTRFKEITRRDSADRVIQNIQMAIDAGLKVKVNCVVMQGVNNDEIIDMIELTREFPISLRFIEFMPFDKNSWAYEKAMLMEDILATASRKYASVRPLSEELNATSKRFAINGFKGDFGVISTVSEPFCSSCNRMRLTADGKMKNCLFSNNEANILEAYRTSTDISGMIKMCLMRKELSRGGMESQQSFKEMGAFHKNRSMIAIGG